MEWSDGDCAGHMRFRTGENQYCGNHNGSSAQTQGAHILAAAITMRFAAYHNHCFANHNGSNSNAQNRRGPQRRQRAPQPLLQSLDTAPATVERAGPPGYCAGHCGESRAPSGDNVRRSPVCSLWILRRPLWREPGPQRRPRAPQPLLQSLDTAPATAERAGPPAATTRAAARSTAPATASRVPSGDNARRSPFCSLWILRRPLRREPGPQQRQRAPQPLLQSLQTAPATAERAGPPAATTRAAAPSAVSGYCAGHCGEAPRAAAPAAVSGDCAGHCGESRAPSGDNARRSPVCSLWILRRPLWREPGPQRRQRAPQPLLQSLDTAPATAERAGPPAATTKAAAPSAVIADVFVICICVCVRCERRRFVMNCECVCVR